VKMPAATYQSQALGQRPRLAVPEHDSLVWPHHPLAVGGVQVDRNTTESPAPLDHAGIVMGVGNGDGRYATHRLERLNHCFIDQRQAVPQNVSLLSPQE